MKCPKCKKDVTEDVLKGPHCGSRIGLTCKKCGTVNFILNKVCKNCGSELLKVCPSCKAVNFPEAKQCRKCGHVFESKTETSEIQKEAPKKIEETINIEKSGENKLSQGLAKDVILKGLFSDNKRIVSLSGSRGTGKSVVLKTMMYEAKDKNWVYGECTPSSQLTPGGFIQGVFLSLFNLPEICLNNPQFEKTAYSFVKKAFPQMNDREIFDIINFLYPHLEGKFEDLLENKNKTFALLEKVFNKVISIADTVFVIDNFEYIDGFSYEFIMRYMENSEVFERMRLLLTYNESRPANGWFYYPEHQAEDCYLDVELADFEYDGMKEVFEAKKNATENYPELNEEELYEIYKLSKGNPAFFEQIFALKYDCGKANQPFEMSANFEGVIGQRLALLSYLNSGAYKFLIGAAILGKRINIGVLQEVFELSVEDLKSIVDYLMKAEYIIPYSDVYFEFKNAFLWEAVTDKAKLDEGFIAANEKILAFLGNFTLNSIAILGAIAQNLQQPQLAFNIWSKNVRYTSYIGDTSLYVISQKQCLAILNEFDDKETLKIRYNIAERLGKILTKTNPKEAMDFLPDALNNAKMEGNEPKETELLGYLAFCCRKVGNYNGEIECTDNVIEKVKDKMTPLNMALLKCTKLNALLNIGDSGQIINMVDTEIMPVFDEFFDKKPDNKNQTVAFVFESWIKTYLVLSKALIMQGNSRAFEALAILFEIIEKNKIEDELFVSKCKIALAMANTMKGNFKISKKLLDDTMHAYQENIMDNEAVIQWNLTDIINKFIQKNYKNIQEDLFNIVTFADNNGDNFTKNILKVMLGKFFKDSGDTKKAMDIYNEQIVYFAKEKMAFGALLTWYMISDATLIL